MIATARLAAPVEGVASVVSSQPMYVWVATVIGVAALLVGAVDKFGGKVGKWRLALLEHRRTAREQKDKAQQDREDSRIGDLQAQVAGLKASLADVRSSIDRQHERHEEDRRRYEEDRRIARREQATKEAMVTALTGHTWEWRRAHDAAGRPYPEPTSPTQPEGITDYLPPRN